MILDEKKFFSPGGWGGERKPLDWTFTRVMGGLNPAPFESGATPQGSGTASSNGAGFRKGDFPGPLGPWEIPIPKFCGVGVLKREGESLISKKGSDLEGGLRSRALLETLYTVE